AARAHARRARVEGAARERACLRRSRGAETEEAADTTGAAEPRAGSAAGQVADPGTGAAPDRALEVRHAFLADVAHAAVTASGDVLEAGVTQRQLAEPRLADAVEALRVRRAQIAEVAQAHRQGAGRTDIADGHVLAVVDHVLGALGQARAGPLVPGDRARG